MAFGTAIAGPGAYSSLANVSGCEKCHGTPYLKHGYRDPIVAGLPDFASCKSCHYDSRGGNHRDWQYMVDRPVDWATGVALMAGEYDYTANIMNDVHMAHAMEFPYPQSMQNCATCHEGNIPDILADANFTPETCKSCHPVKGTDAWPEDVGATLEGDYAQPHRAPPIEYLWEKKGVGNLAFHTETLAGVGLFECSDCHFTGSGIAFSDLHTGYDVNIHDATGQKYSDLYTVSIDNITMSGNLLTVNFSSSDPTIVPELLVSLYGWDSKHFIIASHTRDDSLACINSRSGNASGCRMEFAPGDTNPLFIEDAASVAGDWMVTVDLGAYVPTPELPDDIPTLIANGVIKKAEVTITPELTLDGVDVVLTAANETFDLGASMIVPDYFKGANATVSTAKCNVCHDALASSFHSESGRGGDGIEVCKNCHVPTSPGSHIEMASRSIESYVHAIHSFQAFDIDDTFEEFDPVLAKRYDQHVNHVFPNFTIRNCEACHLPGTYNVPDQSKSMPGVLRASMDVATWYALDANGLAVEDTAGRNIGTVPEYVVGPASKACGACHRARDINDDLAGSLAAFNAHTEAGGTLVENDGEDLVLYGIIDKIMSLFE
jgi:OmcA/MtrC family decaheme c-type cytochrome